MAPIVVTATQAVSNLHNKVSLAAVSGEILSDIFFFIILIGNQPDRQYNFPAFVYMVRIELQKCNIGSK